MPRHKRMPLTRRPAQDRARDLFRHRFGTAGPAQRKGWHKPVQAVWHSGSWRGASNDTGGGSAGTGAGTAANPADGLAQACAGDLAQRSWHSRPRLSSGTAPPVPSRRG
jgi:hypothetical protein